MIDKSLLSLFIILIEMLFAVLVSAVRMLYLLHAEIESHSFAFLFLLFSSVTW